MTKVSILIPTYKRPARLLEALQSCLAQTRPAHEIIIGDDSPDENTEALVQGLQAEVTVPIRYLHHRPSLGQAPNVNYLFDQATGDKLLLLHDDDLLVSTALETLIGCFEEDSGLSVAYGRQYIIHDDGTISAESSESFNRAFFRTAEYEHGELTPLEAGILQQFPNNAYLISTELAQQVKYRNIGDACDFDFGLRVGKTGRNIRFINTYTAKYRLSAEGVSTSPSCDNGLVSFLMVQQTPVPLQTQPLKEQWLKDKAAVAVGQAIATKQFALATQIYFSKYHFHKILTLGGARRLLQIVFSPVLFGLLPRI